MKRTFAVLASVLMAVLAMPVTAQTTELTVFVENSTNLAGIKAVADAFKAKTGIQVTFDLHPAGAEGGNMVKTRLATGDMDDINWYNSGSLFDALNPPKNFVDLTNEPFMVPVIDSFKKLVTYEGKIYAAPEGTLKGGGWYYNKAIYAKLGLKVPKTWKELMANLAKIKAAGITPIIAPYKDSWTAQLLILADFYNVVAKAPNFARDYTAHKATYADTPSALRGFEKLAEVYAKGYINKDASSTTFELATKALADGKAAHFPMVTFATGTIADLNPTNANDIGFFAQPGDDAASNGLTIWMPQTLAIYKGSKNIDAAKQFIAFYLSPEGLATRMAAEPPQGPWAVKGVKMPDNIAAATKDILPYVDADKTTPALEFVSPIKGPNLPQISVEVGLGMKTPLQGAKDYDKDVVKQAKQLGLPGW